MQHRLLEDKKRIKQLEDTIKNAVKRLQEYNRKHHESKQKALMKND